MVARLVYIVLTPFSSYCRRHWLPAKRKKLQLLVMPRRWSMPAAQQGSAFFGRTQAVRMHSFCRSSRPPTFWQKILNRRSACYPSWPTTTRRFPRFLSTLKKTSTRRRCHMRRQPERPWLPSRPVKAISRLTGHPRHRGLHCRRDQLRGGSHSSVGKSRRRTGRHPRRATDNSRQVISRLPQATGRSRQATSCTCRGKTRDSDLAWRPSSSRLQIGCQLHRLLVWFA
mmetsp:Transcript_32640/g.76503  ORF Transcript_32640/g.76503 Transcript_32640/m.76503 type:complete len:227 (-) Transcript_32640:311-991(-)